MGLLDAFFGKADRKRIIAFPELEGWVVKETADSKKEIVDSSKPVVRGILDARDRVKESVLKLKELPLEDTPPRLKNILRASKPEYTSSMLDVLNGITLEEDADYESTINFQKNLTDSLEKIAKTTLSHGRYLPFAHGDAFAAIQKEIKNLIDAKKAMETVFAKAGRIRQLEGIRESRSEFEKTVEGKTKIKDRTNDLNKENTELDDKLSKARNEHMLLLEDRHLLDLRKKMDENTEQRERIRTLVHENLTSINRPLRKYQRTAISEKRLPQEAERNLDGFIENPIDHYLSGKNPSAILSDMEKAIAEGKIEVKNPEKLGRAIRDINANLKPSLAGEYNNLLEEAGRIQNDLNNSPAAQKTQGVEFYIEQLKNKIMTKNDELKALEKKTSETEDDLKDTRQKLEEQLREFNITLTDNK